MGKKKRERKNAFPSEALSVTIQTAEVACRVVVGVTRVIVGVSRR